MKQGQDDKPRGLATRADLRIVLVCTVLAIGIFHVDVKSLPLGVAAGVAYVGVVLISLWLSQWRLSLLIAGGVSALTILGFLLSEPAGIAWMVITNRLLALSAIWLTAIVGGWLVFSRRKKLVGALNRAEKEVDQARKAKFRFLDATSNEMRQHLQTLSLLSAAMSKTVTEPKAQEISTKQVDAVAHLAGLLNSILEFCELESGDVKPKITEVPVQDIFQQLQDEFGSQAQTKGLRLRFGTQAEIVSSDGKLLTQILRSLVSNAIRYTDQGEVDVSCQRESNGLRITVRDSGIGIAPDEMATIFDEFYRVNSDPVDRGSGRGLGLSIVNRGLELLQSRIEVESELGKGSTFSFVIQAR